MSAPQDPAWLRAAERVYAACLFLYPAALRREHGTQMQQAFRDRCREVADGRSTAWRVFGRELAPDLLASAAGAHAEASRAGSSVRLASGVAVLALLALALATQPRWSAGAVDGMTSVARLHDQVVSAREFQADRELARATSSRLAATGNADSLAVAALLQRSLFDQDHAWLIDDDGEGMKWIAMRQPDDGAEATRLAVQAMDGEPSLAALSIATQACTIEAGCDQDRALLRLLARDPDNAFNWSLEFKRAAQRHDAARMQAAIAGAGQARYFNAQVATLERVLLDGDVAAAADADTLQTLHERLRAMRNVGTDDWTNDLRYHCSQRVLQGKHPARWIDHHPEGRAACLNLARVQAASSDVFSASWGWRQLWEAGLVTTPAQRQAARDTLWLQWQMHVGWNPRSDGRGSTPWLPVQWQAWDAARAAGDGELTAFRRWRLQRGLPIHAPADFRTHLPGDTTADDGG